MILPRVPQRIELAFWITLIALIEKRQRIRQAFLPLLSLCLAVIAFRLFYVGIAEYSPAAFTRHGFFDGRNSISNVTVSNQQQNLLLILVDDLGSASPQLESIWLMAFLPTKTELTLIPLYPASLTQSKLIDNRLKNSFQLSSDLAPARDFLENLKSLNLWWDYYLIVDYTALARMINQAGGITLNSNLHFTGEGAVSYAASGGETPRDQIARQTSLVQGLCQTSHFFPGAAELTQLVERTPRHISTNVSLEQIVSNWRRLLSAGEKLNCDFPTISPVALKPDRP